MLYYFGRFVFLLYFKLFYRLQVSGSANLPGMKPFIICANHISWMDPLAIGAAIPAWYRINYMAKKELFKNYILRKLLLMVGAFPVNRQDADFTAVKKAYNLLKEGQVLGVFPEGTRSTNGLMQKAYNGAALIAVRSGIPILPVAVEGPYRFFEPLTIHIGQLFVLPPLIYEQKNEKKEQLDALSAIIISNINKLLPEKQSK